MTQKQTKTQSIWFDATIAALLAVSASKFAPLLSKVKYFNNCWIGCSEIHAA